MLEEARRRLVFPLDYPTLDEARTKVPPIAREVGVLKVGLELFVREGPAAVAFARDLGRDVFLDLKLCDIPETVERAVASAVALGARYLTVHASAGRAALERAAARAARAPEPLTILAITVLTSLDTGDLRALGVDAAPSDQVLRLGRLARDAGAGGLVASPAEVGALRAALGRDVVLVAPGVRPAGGERGDQKRVATPEAAIASGADLLVVGRPIRDATDPPAAARGIVDAIGRALASAAG